MAKLRELIVDVRTNTAKFSQGMERVESKLNKTSKSIKAIGSALAGAFAVSSIIRATKDATEFADSIAKNARNVGLLADEYQSLSFAARRSGVDQSVFDSSMVAFVKRVGEAKQGTGQLVAFLKKYDEQLLSGIQKSTSQADALKIVLDAINKAKSAAEKASIANAAFSRSGVRLGLMAGDYRTLQDEAGRLGIVLSNDVVAGAEQASDSIENMTAKSKKEFTEMWLTLSPLIVKMDGMLAALGRSVGNLYNAFSKGDATSPIAVLQEKLGTLYAKVTKDSERLDKTHGRNSAQLRKRIKRDKEEIARLAELIAQKQGKPAEGAKPISPKIELPVFEPFKKTTNSHTEEKTFKKIIDEGAIAAKELADKFHDLKIEVSPEFRYTEAVKSLDDFKAQVEKSGAIFPDSLYSAKLKQLQDDMLFTGETWGRVAGVISDISADTPGLDALKEKVLAIKADMREGWILPEEAQTQIDQALKSADALKKVSEKAKEFREKEKQMFDTISEGLSSTMGSALGNLVSGQQKFSNVIKSMIGDIVELIVKVRMMKAIESSGSGGGFGSIISTLFGGARAGGGPVNAGKAYLVGEKGPELFMPGNSGSITPNSSLSGKSQPVVNLSQSFNVTGSITEQDIRRLIAEGSHQAVATIKNEVANQGQIVQQIRGAL